MDVRPFAAVMENLQLSMATTDAGHIQPASLNGGEQVKVKPNEAWDVLYSGNTVNLEQEMMKAGDINRAHSLNVNIVHSFHQMLMNAVKS